MLGSKCVRCGITHPLVWDHIQDDGCVDRAARPGVRMFIREQAEFGKIIETGRSDRLQLLCPNCNSLKAYDRAAYDAPPTYGPRRA